MLSGTQHYDILASIGQLKDLKSQHIRQLRELLDIKEAGEKVFHDAFTELQSEVTLALPPRIMLIVTFIFLLTFYSLPHLTIGFLSCISGVFRRSKVLKSNTLVLQLTKSTT